LHRIAFPVVSEWYQEAQFFYLRAASVKPQLGLFHTALEPVVCEHRVGTTQYFVPCVSLFVDPRRLLCAITVPVAVVGANFTEIPLESSGIHPEFIAVRYRGGDIKGNMRRRRAMGEAISRDDFVEWARQAAAWLLDKVEVAWRWVRTQLGLD
jgi:hypothetical protein